MHSATMKNVFTLFTYILLFLFNRFIVCLFFCFPISSPVDVEVFNALIGSCIPLHNSNFNINLP
jgi:hypothetical protein